MELKYEQFQKLESYLPKQRGNVKIDNFTLLYALLYAVKNGCTWRALPEKYGKWYTIYMRLNRWSKNGVLDRIFKELHEESIIDINVDVVCLDFTSVKVHPDSTNGKQAIGKSRERLTTKIHVVSASDKTAVSFSLSSGEKGDSS